MTSVCRRPFAVRAMGDHDGQGHGRSKVDDQACGLPGCPVIPVDIQPSFAVVPQLHPVPRFMPNGQQFTDSDEEILAAYEHHAALQVTPVMESPTEGSDRINGVQATTLHNQLLTESDEELLQACDTFTALQKSQADSISLDDFVRNEYATEGASQVCSDARSPSVEEWARSTILAAATPDLSELLGHDAQTLAKIVRYINDIASFSTILGDRPTNSWPCVAAQWVDAVFLLQQLRLRVAVYHPHTWDHSQCRAFAMSDAADWDRYLREIALHPLSSRYEAASNANGVRGSLLVFSESAPSCSSCAVLPRAAARTADGRDLFWL